MKKYSIDIHFLLLILVIILMTFISGCSITRKVNKESQEITTEKTADETVKTVSDITTENKEQVASTTSIVENIDTVVTVAALPTGDSRLDEYLKNNPLKVPVKFNRVTNKQEYTNKQESKKENVVAIKENKSTEIKQSIVEKKNVYQKTTPSFVFWGLGVLVVLAIAFGIYKSGILKKFF